MVDYGNLESRTFSEVWPYRHNLGKEEPFQVINDTGITIKTYRHQYEDIKIG